jgi:hypothetical protein
MIKTPIIIISLLVPPAIAQETYRIKAGDVLTRLVQARYPTERIYGRNGKLAWIIKLNPQLINPNLLRPNEHIFFDLSTASIPEKPLLSCPAASEVINPEKTISRQVSGLPAIEEWNISALFGAKYLSLTQTGALGGAELGVLALNNIKLHSEFKYNEWSLGFQFDSYQFRTDTTDAVISDPMHAANLYGSYNWFLAGINLEQTPLIRNIDGNIELTRMTLMSLSLGAKKDFELPTQKPTALKLKGWFSYPFSVRSRPIPASRFLTLPGQSQS